MGEKKGKIWNVFLIYVCRCLIDRGKFFFFFRTQSCVRTKELKKSVKVFQN